MHAFNEGMTAEAAFQSVVDAIEEGNYKTFTETVNNMTNINYTDSNGVLFLFIRDFLLPQLNIIIIQLLFR